MYGVSFRNLRDDAKASPYVYVKPLELHGEVLRCNPEAFECCPAGKHSACSLSAYLNVNVSKSKDNK